MKIRIWIALCLTVLFCAAPPAGAVNLKHARGGLLAAADGRGDVQLLWFPPAGRWPLGGWRLEAARDHHVLQARIRPGEAEALKKLSAQDAAAVGKLREVLAKATNPKETQLIYGLLGLRALSDWNYARALGLAWTLRDVPGGRRVYRVIGLTAEGRPSGVVLTSKPVDARVATPLPAAPRRLHAESRDNGVALYWSPAPVNPALPVISYFVERDGGGQSAVPVTPKGLVLGVRWDEKLAELLDPNAPLETELIYRVYSVDLFGRRSVAAQVKFFAADLKALEPPLRVYAKARPGKIKLTWKVSGNPHTAGYVVERAYLYGGPYETLTPKGLPANAGRYTDRRVRGGTAYYYRVRAMGPRGNLGHASLPVMAQPRNKGAPDAPRDLKAQVGRSRVRLTWHAAHSPVAGYIVERRAQGTKQWFRMNSRVTPEPLYDDYYGEGRHGGFSYRVVTVGFDNRKSGPSETASVTLPDTAAPPAPRITGISGAGGKVRIEFAPAPPAKKTHSVLVLRGGSAIDPGLVIGDPLPADAREFVDTFVQPGQDYWYRLVAVDKHGNHSHPGKARVVTVAAPSIPQPARPRIKFEADPFAHVKIAFDAPPPGLAVVVQSRAGQGKPWIVLAGPIADATQAIDANPPEGKLQYRIVYQAANGAQGKPSKAVGLSRP